MEQNQDSPAPFPVTANRREFPRLNGAFQVRYGVCGAHGPQVPGFTRDMGIGGICFAVPKTEAKVGDHLALEISVPGYEEPLYFLGEVKRVEHLDGRSEIALSFEFLGKSENYKELLEQLIREHGVE